MRGAKLGPLVGPVLLAVALSSLLSGCLDSFVGATCADGYTERGGVCVPLGGADTGVDAGDSGIDADLDASMDAGLDSSIDGAADSSTDGAADSGTDGAADSGPPGCDLGERLCGTECVRTGSDPNHCGDCFNMCGAAEFCSGGSCEPACLAPEEICDGRCFDPAVSNDPDNCGSCGRRCASGLCLTGTCVDAMAGHIILVGHDYEQSRAGMDRLAGNSVFLALGATVEVLTWEGTATASSIRGVDRAVDRVARERGRMWSSFTPPSSDEILEELATAEVFLLYPQPETTDSELTALGASLRTGLETFLLRGGVVVVFDTPSATNTGTFHFLAGAGLMNVTSHSDVTGETLMVTAPGDAVSLNVPLSYVGEINTVRFDSTAPVVVAHPDGPVVLHAVLTP